MLAEMRCEDASQRCTLGAMPIDFDDGLGLRRTIAVDRPQKTIHAANSVDCSRSTPATLAKPT
jgi:hypothetical protein